MFRLIEHLINNDFKTFLEYPNVIGVASGYKVTNGMPTTTPCLAVFVKEKVEADQLNENEIIPTFYKGATTDVVATGEFTVDGLTDKVRPVQFGYSIGISGLSGFFNSGTGGCLVADKSDPTVRYILGSNHVLVNDNVEPVGTTVLQPARPDAPLSAGKVAALSRYIPVLFMTPTDTPINYVDCAIAQLTSIDMAVPNIAFIGIPKGIDVPAVGMAVKKTGKTTGFTTGVVQYTAATVVISYSSTKQATFAQQIITTKMSGPGDSGAALVNNDNKVLGLLVGSTNNFSVYNPINEVLRVLSVYVVTG
ncbi:MAG: trypsin-like peptidase domain-containing protein [Clostridium sp.]